MVLDQQTQIQLPIKQKKIKYKSLPQIMIIDDDPELLEELRGLLSFKYEVETLFNSTNAFEKARELRPALIIMDMKMSPKTGFQLVNEFRNSLETKFIPIVAITGFYMGEKDALMMEFYGVKRILLKPFSSKQLFEEIELVLKNSKLRWN